jgi:hypothetical protein
MYDPGLMSNVGLILKKGPKEISYSECCPIKIKNMESFPIFKKALKSFLLNHALYTVDEFIGFNTKRDV